jgi:hypothetical protein
MMDRIEKIRENLKQDREKLDRPFIPFTILHDMEILLSELDRLKGENERMTNSISKLLEFHKQTGALISVPSAILEELFFKGRP